MTNIIKLRFLHDGAPSGREYTYFTPIPVSVGDTVSIDGHKKGIVTQIDVPEEEIAAFRDRAKTIVGVYTPGCDLCRGITGGWKQFLDGNHPEVEFNYCPSCGRKIQEGSK